MVDICHKLEIKFKGFEVLARICMRRIGNGSWSLNRMADWCQVEISGAKVDVDGHSLKCLLEGFITRRKVAQSSSLNCTVVALS